MVLGGPRQILGKPSSWPLVFDRVWNTVEGVHPAIAAKNSPPPHGMNQVNLPLPKQPAIGEHTLSNLRGREGLGSRAVPRCRFPTASSESSADDDRRRRRRSHTGTQ